MTHSTPSHDVQMRYDPFKDEVLSGNEENIHSIHITGSALTADYDPKRSDINSVIVLNTMDLLFLEHLAPLGKKHGKKRISAPLIMTPAYIKSSLDVFPLEFLNIKLLHHTVYGEDAFSNLNIDLSDLRQQCEREIKVRLIGLRQGYLSSMGEPKLLTDSFIRSISGYIPLFRGIILLLRKEPPIRNFGVLTMLQEASGVDMKVFRLVLEEKKQRTRLGKEHLNILFEASYRTVEKLGELIDDLST
ncbi:MAG TPA: hypothetical protein HPQ03_05055 [Deltaproteobacteria bacterium]|nr:hypothetical protein [Deltaproteobacteria bacterium]